VTHKFNRWKKKDVPLEFARIAREKDLVLDYTTTLKVMAQSNLWIDTANPQDWVLKRLDETLPLKQQFISLKKRLRILIDNRLRKN
jgi:hypothetical protein